MQASAVPKKVVKVTDSTSALATGGLDGLPREDISEKITPTLLKGLESSDWKVLLHGCLRDIKFVNDLRCMWSISFYIFY